MDGVERLPPEQRAIAVATLAKANDSRPAVIEDRAGDPGGSPSSNIVAVDASATGAAAAAGAGVVQPSVTGRPLYSLRSPTSFFLRILHNLFGAYSALKEGENEGARIFRK